jgi:hypothetical protein
VVKNVELSAFLPSATGGGEGFQLNIIDAVSSVDSAHSDRIIRPATVSSYKLLSSPRRVPVGSWSEFMRMNTIEGMIDLLPAPGPVFFQSAVSHRMRFRS